MTALIVLASGTSTRFKNGNKLLADLNGMPVLQHVIDNAAGIEFSGRYGVIADESVEAIFKANNYVCVRNPSPEDGMGNALSFGVEEAFRDGHSSAMIMLGDMPFVGANHLQALLDTNGDVIMSEYEGVRLPPSIFRGATLGELAYLSGDLGGKSAIINPANVKTIALSQSAARDIDTSEDLDKAT